MYINRTAKFSGGPSVFKKRFLSVLSTRPEICMVSDIDGDYDVELAFIRSEQRKKPVVLRIDGCYYFPEKLRLNEAIKTSIKNANHVIFQSEFSMNMCKRLLSVDPSNYSVVYNGVDLQEIGQITPNPKIKPGSFVCCADWRPNKRPKSTIHGFMKSGVKDHLYVIGGGVKPASFEKRKNIHFLGHLEPDRVIAVMKACKYFIHLCHIDSCPNAVVEALSCGLKVLCTNLGGSRELIQGNGVMLDVDVWDWRPIPFKNIDSLTKRSVADGILKLMSLPDASAITYDINETVDKYVHILRTVANCT